MKKHISLLCCLLSCACIFSACGGKDKNAVKVSEKPVNLEVDEKYTLKASTHKDNNIVWSSNDEKIAVIAPDGTITAVGSGITTVTAEARDKKDNLVGYAHVGVVVGGDGDYVDEHGNKVLTFNGESDISEIEVGVKAGGRNDVSLKKGEEHQLKAYTTPEGSRDEIVWQSKDPTICQVDEKGRIIANKPGKTTVTAYAPNGVKGELIVRVK